jgi:hypothetical protein
MAMAQTEEVRNPSGPPRPVGMMGLMAVTMRVAMMSVCVAVSLRLIRNVVVLMLVGMGCRVRVIVQVWMRMRV